LTPTFPPSLPFPSSSPLLTHPHKQGEVLDGVFVGVPEVDGQFVVAAREKYDVRETREIGKEVEVNTSGVDSVVIRRRTLSLLAACGTALVLSSMPPSPLPSSVYVLTCS